MLVELGLVEQRYQAVLEVLNVAAVVVSASVPGCSSVDRCLVRHGLISPQPRRRKRSDCKRWERARAMELWQMDIVGGVRLVDGSEAKIVSGIDDHSRFVISARVVARATARPVCDALEYALAAHGVPEAILTDNGKVFTARFGPGSGPVRSDRICRNQGIDHLLTAPRSPTATGKVERWHKTCAASSSPAGSSTASPMRRPSWMSGSSTTTTSGHIRRSDGCRPPNGSSSPLPGRARSRSTTPSRRQRMSR